MVAVIVKYLSNVCSKSAKSFSLIVTMNEEVKRKRLLKLTQLQYTMMLKEECHLEIQSRHHPAFCIGWCSFLWGHSCQDLNAKQWLCYEPGLEGFPLLVCLVDQADLEKYPLFCF